MKIEPTDWLTTRIVGFIARVTPKCHDMTRLISQERDATLSRGLRVKMQMHFTICVWCLRYRNQLGFLGKALHICPEEPLPPTVPGLPDEAKERLKRALQKPT